MIKLYKTNKRGDEQIIRLLRPGEITGYRAVLEDEPYAATAEAIETSTVCIISREMLLGLLRAVPDVTARLLAKMAQELRVSEEQMLSFARESVRQRTARLLLFLMKSGSPTPEGSARTLRVPILRSEMAQMIGTTAETLSRTLHGFAKQGILRRSKWWHRADPPQLDVDQRPTSPYRKDILPGSRNLRPHIISLS